MNVPQLTDVAQDWTTAFAHLPAELKVYCPIPLRSHACDVQAIDEQAVAWLLKFGLCKPNSLATRMGCAAGIAPALPRAGESTILTVTKHFYWGSVLDDFWDSYPDDLARMVAHAGELQRVMYAAADAPLSPGDPWAASLRDLRSPIEKVLSDDGIAAFRHEHAAWLNGQLWYTGLQRRAEPPEIGEYLRMRWAKVGVGTLVHFTAAARGSHQLNVRQLGEPALRAFTEAVMMACALLNDLFSVAKEIITGTATTNLLTVLNHTEGLGTVAALATGWQLYERVVALAMRLQQQLLADPRPNVNRFATELPNWISAGIQFVSTTARYYGHSSGELAFTAPQVTVSATPTLWDADDLTPPPYPEIAWWWRQLK